MYVLVLLTEMMLMRRTLEVVSKVSTASAEPAA
jgi:hypothetical protein